MSFQIPITIAAAIESIEHNTFLLPGIQREFEWKHGKIEWLFDSIMRKYPISSFLFWRVEGETRSKYHFYKILREYRETYKTHNEEFPTSNHKDFTAVLDGQQRLTSLFIGLKGSYAYRTPRLKEENSERVYPTRHLYLNINQPLSNEEDGRVYEFKFLTESEFNKSPEMWFKVSEIMNLSSFNDFRKYMDGSNINKDNEFAYETISRLHEVVHSEKIINYFLETEQSIEKALNIFIRINSGGEPLDFSDLLMSIAVANWDKKNAKEEINSLVDSVRDKGFRIKKDLILKTFLYLHSKDIKFKVTNFSKENAIEFEKQWEKIRDVISSTMDLVKSFGFTDATLTSQNSLIPIFYYLYHKGIYQDFHTKVNYQKDRALIKKWLHVVLIKRAFGGTSDSILSQIRKAFTSDVITNPNEFKSDLFPIQSIYENTKREMGVTDEFIEEILKTQKDDVYAFSILALLYPNLDYKNNNFHKDHLHPEESFKSLNQDLKDKYGWKTYNSILNLQMLDANENMAKNDKDLISWVKSETKGIDVDKFLNNHLIPYDKNDESYGLHLNNFEWFIEERRKSLAAKLKETLT
jgi:uncharacterized protein with ParB-like and HNH nuclease domain